MVVALAVFDFHLPSCRGLKEKRAFLRPLKSRLRGSDYLARMGGDEFAVLLTNVSANDLPTLADGFRRVLTATPFTYGGKNYRITLSVGAARLDRDTGSLNDAMAHADIACHIAKNAGRNQTHLYTPASGRQAVTVALRPAPPQP